MARYSVNGGGQLGAGLLSAVLSWHTACRGRRWQWAMSGRMPSSSARARAWLVVGFGLLRSQGIAPRRNLAEEAQGIRLVAPFLVLTGERQRTLGEGVRLLQAASQQLRLPQGETTERLNDDHFRCNGLFQRLREQWHGVGDAPGQRCMPPPRPQPSRGNRREVRLLTDAHGPFEQGSALGRSPWRRASRPSPHEATMRLAG